MTGPSTASDNASRTQLYLGSAEQGIVFNRKMSFYSGSPTSPTSFTGNQILGVSSNGPGASIINGVGPVLTVPIPCNEVVVESVSFLVFLEPPTTILQVSYNAQEDDILVMFIPGTGTRMAFDFVTVTPGVGLSAKLQSDPPPGTYTLKIMRASDPVGCFYLQPNFYTVEGVVCTIDAGAWTLPGGVPFPPFIFGVGPPVAVEITGSGFLSCTIGVSVDLAGFPGPPPTQAVTSLVVVDDNTITFDVSRVGIGGGATYEATVFCTDLGGCADVADNTIFFAVA